MNIIYTHKVERSLEKIPKQELNKIFQKIKRLSEDVASGKPLKGEFDGYLSLRAWPYRIIYKVQGRSIYIYSIAHRKDVYK